MLSEKIIDWYYQNKRDLPWRNTKNPYFIWLSEVILQQTRVEQGMSYYNTFIENYPTVQDLANAPEEEVLRTWQGLGYYSRARNLHFSAKYICDELNGEFPKTYKELLKLKGVGNYTAAAISSISFNEAQAVVDGNVYRFLSRLFEIKTPINTGKALKEFEETANSLIDSKRPGDFNQAMMEIGARICKPTNPTCSLCPVNTQCKALKNETQTDYPVKLKKQKVKNRYFNYLILKKDNKIYLEKRIDMGIWNGLFEFYLIESNEPIKEIDNLSSQVPNWINLQTSLIEAPTHKQHLLSHQRIHATFWPINLAKIDTDKINSFFSVDEIEDLPKHKLIVNYLLDNNV